MTSLSRYTIDELYNDLTYDSEKWGEALVSKTSENLVTLPNINWSYGCLTVDHGVCQDRTSLSWRHTPEYISVSAGSKIYIRGSFKADASVAMIALYNSEKEYLPYTINLVEGDTDYTVPGDDNIAFVRFCLGNEQIFEEQEIYIETQVPVSTPKDNIDNIYEQLNDLEKEPGEDDADGAPKNVWYGTGAKAGSSSQYINVTTTSGDFVLADGNMVYVKLTSKIGVVNTVSLNVDSTGSIDTDIGGAHWCDNEIVGFVYSESKFLKIDAGTATTQKIGKVLLSSSLSSDSLVTAATSSAVKNVYTYAKSIEDVLGGKVDQAKTAASEATTEAGEAKTLAEGAASEAAEAKTLAEGAAIQIVTTGGTSTAYTATVPGITALTAGVNFIMLPHASPMSGSVTLDVNNLGAKNLKLATSNGGVVDGSGTSWLYTGKPLNVIYNGTYWVIQNMIRTVAGDLYGTLAIGKGGTGKTSYADTTYTSVRYRGTALYNTDTDPTTNGVINWMYK